MARAFLFILDSFGIGGAPDAERYGDLGANTYGHIAKECAEGKADVAGLRSGPLALPNLSALGLGLAARAACGDYPQGVDIPAEIRGRWANACEISKGKDTPSGHWEIAGVPVLFDWGYFQPDYPSFPQRLVEQLCEAAGLPGILANKAGSGTDILAEFGEEHIRSGKPICYTSSDSVFQIAAHEDSFGLDRLFELCETTRKMVDRYNIGRVIARPFVGDDPSNFERTGNRRDYSVPPHEATLLDRANASGRDVIAVGKIDDIYAHSGPTHVRKANGNAALFDATLSAVDACSDGGLVMTNFVDFDMLYGHRRDVAGYAAALEYFDRRLPEIMDKLREDDMMVLTADHGCDPTWHGSDHTREQVPVLLWSEGIEPGYCGTRTTFADIGETIAEHLGLGAGPHGESFYHGT